MKDLKQTLIDFGFTSNEANVYLGLLSTRGVKVGEITEITGITRTQLYPLLSKMLKRGFIREIDKNPSKYMSVDPSKLISGIYEGKQNEIKKLIKLKNSLEGVKAIRTISNMPYRSQIIVGKENLRSKIISLVEEAKEEILFLGVFERPLIGVDKESIERYRKILKKNVKMIIYLSVKPQNLFEFEKIKKRFREVDIGGIIDERPSDTFIIDKRFVIIVFYDFDKKEHNAGVLIESPSLAESFAKREISRITANPLKGEAYMDVYGSSLKVFMLPSYALNTLPKKTQFKIGYDLGKEIEKKARVESKSIKSTIYNSQWNMRLAGWGKVKAEYINKNKAVIRVEKPVLPCSTIKGTFAALLNRYGNFSINETKCIENGNEICEIVATRK